MAPCQVYNPERIGHVMTIRDPGQVNRQDNPGFCAIGSGALNALSMLYYREQDYTDPLWQSIYTINEAKIFAGEAPGVGEWDTELIILANGKEPRYLTDAEVSKLDLLYIKEGLPRLPQRLKARLSKMLAEPPMPTPAAQSGPDNNGQ